eukprot:TRINITY_DN1079_c0_g1_i2.p1 TRINITY_DN1079_c0_g1~~TRINITY_DN1079_c0_g1_i2.p1  ORF type:complete len:316 (-),score=74.37 TRINITY_DN1079_c0_g1_i2:164-1111(-)
MDSSKDNMSSSVNEHGSVVSNIYESKPNLLYQRQRAGTFSSPSEAPWSLPSAPGHRGHKKRRSKHDVVGRDYKCDHCSKSYLSYPALYTHTKTKHVSDPLPSRSAAGKSRKASETFRVSSFADCFDVPERRGVTLEPFRVLDRAVERMDGVMGWGMEKLEEHPLAKAMRREEAEKSCDWVLAEYCRSVARLVNPDYFEKVCLVVLGYRECLNKYGWEKFSESRQEESKFEQCASDSPRIEVLLEYTEEYQRKIKREFSASNDSDRIPEVANEFVLIFAREHDLGLEEQEIVAITMNMCGWLHANNHTKTQVVLIN